MAIVTTVSLTNQAGLEQIISKAESQLLSIAAQLEQDELTLAAKNSELASLQARASARDQQLHIAGQSVAAVKEELAQLRLRVELAEGTLSSDNSADQIRTLEKKVLRMESEEHSLRVKLTKEASTDANREAAARIAFNQAQESIAANTKAQQVLMAAREQAHQELGQLLQKAIMQRLETLKSDLEVRRLAVAKVEQELDAFSTEASEGLLAWPDLLREIKPSLVYRDNTTNILEAQGRVINLLLSEGLGANIDSVDVFRRAGLPWGDMPGLLAFDPANFYPAFNGASSPTILLERKRDIEKLLEVYRAEKKGVASPVVRSAGAKRQRL